MAARQLELLVEQLNLESPLFCSVKVLFSDPLQVGYLFKSFLMLFLSYLLLLLVVSTVMSGLFFARFRIVDYVTQLKLSFIKGRVKNGRVKLNWQEEK